MSKKVRRSRNRVKRTTPIRKTKIKVDDRLFGEALCNWFDANRRDLPWRRIRNGYTALVAETMLQQTQVSRVIESFDRFIARFPDIHALARASDHDVLAMWRGLGYYRRALNLHAAARQIVAEYGGEVPRDVDSLRKLFGVGRYTAGAIASIVFGASAPIVDGNVRRVLARVFAKSNVEDGWAWKMAEQLVDCSPKPGAFNEGFMELGATVCLPRVPKCGECPLQSMCCARRCGGIERFPQTRKTAKPKAVVHHAVVIARPGGTEILVERRGAAGMWANMWQMPTIESLRALRAIEIKSALPVPVSGLGAIGEFTHKTTHRTISFKVYRATSRSREGAWKSESEIEQLPMSNAQRRVIEMAGERSG
jgi:A/G-specific adenine glycosylase